VPSVLTALPSLSDQAERLIELDVHCIAGLPPISCETWQAAPVRSWSCNNQMRLLAGAAS
jgi:hypothetical protein